MSSRARAKFRFTDERRQLVDRFVQFRYLSTSHLYSLYQAGTDVTERGVRRLVHDFWAHGYLHRRVASAAANRPRPASEFVFWLSKKGVALAEDAGASSQSLPDPRPGIARTLDHELAITEFHLAAERAVEPAGIKLHWEQYGLRRGVNPDAMFAVTDPAKPEHESTAYCFLEVERSRLGGYAGGRSVLLRRLKRYAAYQGTEECRADWRWFDEFRVVIVVTSEARRRNLLALLAKELPLPMFWITVDGCDLSQPAFLSPSDLHNRAHALTE
jgi:hypothetical protein